MTQLALNLLPGGISTEVLGNLLTDADGRTLLLQATIRRFEERYQMSLEALEARLARGEGAEHPDWEDSIEWRNALETLQRTEKMRSLLEWLLLWEHGGRYLQRMGGCLLFVILVASLPITLTLLHDFLINI